MSILGKLQSHSPTTSECDSKNLQLRYHLKPLNQVTHADITSEDDDFVFFYLLYRYSAEIKTTNQTTKSFEKI